jgi:riboflavin biosynthesis pyrimidine reductase
VAENADATTEGEAPGAKRRRPRGALNDLATLLDNSSGEDVPLPEALLRGYGALRFPAVVERPYVLANFVTTLDGVVSWNLPGRSGGAEISGFSAEDAAVMGLLRAVSDAVVVGAATLRVIPNHLWVPEHIWPPLKDAYQALRERLGKTRPPLAVMVTGSGEVDLSRRVFTSGEEPALVVTTPLGAERLAAQGVPAGVAVAALPPRSDGKLSARDIALAVGEALGGGAQRMLVEGGPVLLGAFFQEQALDELFLTVAPQVAGRDAALGEAGWRPALVEGATLAPDAPAWGTLVSVKQHANHLFLRYQFGGGAAGAPLTPI